VTSGLAYLLLPFSFKFTAVISELLWLKFTHAVGGIIYPAAKNLTGEVEDIRMFGLNMSLLLIWLILVYYGTFWIRLELIYQGFFAMTGRWLLILKIFWLFCYLSPYFVFILCCLWFLGVDLVVWLSIIS
jgi:hypothetical protein